MGSVRILVGVILSVIGVSGVLPHRLSCEADWFRLSGNTCYKLFHKEDQRTWTRAKEVCESYGSHLVSIKDQYENNNLGKILQNETDSYWIGLNNYNNNQLKWHDGAEITKNQGFWDDGQPDLNKGECVYSMENNQHYVYDKPYVWSFSNCDEIRSYVCERMGAPRDNFHCFSGGFVPNKYVCDGQGDCIDSSDELDCEGNCHQYLTLTSDKDSGTINFNTYENSQTCRWAIETPLGTNAVVEFTSFNIESYADYVQVYISSVVEIHAQRVASLSGNGGMKRRFRSNNNMMLIKFSSDSIINGDSSEYGFSAKYDFVHSSKPEDHVFRLTAMTTVQRFTGFDKLAVATTDYVYSIKAQTPWEIITVEIETFNLHDSDSVTFYDGDSPDANILAKMCMTGCDNYTTVFSTGGSLTIYFRTKKESTKDVDFAFSYKQGCDIMITSRSGVLFSPGFPGNIPYPTFVTCTWQINSDKALAISFSGDSVLQGDTFGRVNNGDYVQIYADEISDAGRALHPNAVGFTYKTLAGQTFQSNGKMFIRFISSPIRNAKGFIAHWSNDCENPMYDDHTLVDGQMKNASYHYTSTNTLSCAEGYDFHQEQITPGTSQIYLECGLKGTWGPYQQIPRCTPWYCGTIPNIMNGYIKSSTGSTYGSTVTYECFTGTKLVAAPGSTGSTITCKLHGSWSASPTCQAASCTFSDIAMRALNLQGSLLVGDGTLIGSIVKYVCDDGYELVGEPTLFCRTDGSWSSNTPSCKKLTCLLPEMKNGDFQNGVSGLIEFQRTVDVVCNTGYIHAGVRSVTCQASRTLTLLPTCINIVECDQNPCSGGGCVDTEGSFYCTCPSGYYLHTNLRTCLDVDECLQDIDNCDQHCSNNEGSYTCSCPDPGYVLYIANGTSGYYIPTSEDGTLPLDTYHINHTCSLIECPSPADIINGQLLTNRVHHRYGDKIQYQCNLGYNPRSTVLTCQTDGEWSGTKPTCQAATCPTDTVGSGTNIATYLPGPYSFGASLDLQCTIVTVNFTKQRHCVYNRDNDDYRLVGAEYECGVIDCGQPMAEPGSNYHVSNTHYQATFLFTCTENKAATGRSGDNTTTVTCGADGYWNLGNLQCFEQACQDPGYPAGGDINATSFADNSEVTFNCIHTGYELSHTNALKCEGTTWSGTVPTCQDTQAPVFDKCDNLDPIVIKKYELLYPSLDTLNIQVTDNTGIASLTISPSNANTTLVMENSGTIRYTARDYAGTSTTCEVLYRVYDETPPTVTCPPLYKILLQDDADTATHIITDSLFNTSDNSGVIKSIEILDRPQTTFTKDDLYKTFSFTAQVKDSNDNIATCKAQVFVSAPPCSPLSYPNVVNAGVPICTRRTGNIAGFNCIITANPGYILRDHGQTKEVSCVDASPWDEVIPAAVNDTNAPILLCPTPMTIWLATDNDTKEFLMNTEFTENVHYTVTDIGGVDSSRTFFSPSSLSLTSEDLYTSHQIAMTAYDLRGNNGTCEFEIIVRPLKCSPLSLPTPLNGTKTCEKTEEGYLCTLTCNSNYSFDSHANTSMTLSCSGESWAKVVMACSQTTNPVPTVRVEEYVYSYKHTREIVQQTLECFDHYKEQQEYLYLNMSKTMAEQCTDVNITFFARQTFVKIIDAKQVNISYRFKLVSSDYRKVNECSISLRNFFHSGNDSLAKDIVGDGSNCPNLQWITSNNNGSSYQCFTPRYRSLFNNSQCLYCPLGSYSNAEVCMQCPICSYKSNISSNDCTFCPRDTATRFPGSRSLSDCVEICAAGSFSSTGIHPCFKCLIGTYSDSENSTSCVNCPGGQTTSGPGSTSSSQCVAVGSINPEQCSLGTEAVGNGMCKLCDLGWYRSANSKNCTICPNLTSTYVAGAVSSNQCFAKCESGTTSATGRSPCTPCGVGRYSLNPTTCQTCDSGKTTDTNTAGSVSECIDQCPMGKLSYSGYNFDGSCRNCPANYFQDTVGQMDCTRCPPSSSYSTESGLTSSAECLDAETDLCFDGQCENGGQCSIQDNTFLCSCSTGYYGRHCELQVRYCNSSPCFNGGLCSEARDGHTCDCQGTATGLNCEVLTKTCASSSCDSGGDCLNRPGHSECLCRSGYTGQKCANIQKICSSNPCNNGGTCSDISFGKDLHYKCTCPTEYTGKICETNIDDCAAPDTCLYGGNCTDVNNDYTCQCPSGYGGKFCKDRTDRCIGITCRGGGICVDDYTQDLHRCICQTGYQFGVYVQYSIEVNVAPSNFGTNSGTSNTVEECRDKCTSDNQCDRFTYETQTSMCYIWNKADNLNMITTNSYNTYTRQTLYPDDDFYSLWYNMATPTSTKNNDNEQLSSLNTEYGLNICGGTEPLGAQCRRVDGQPNQVGITCNENGLQCNLDSAACADYEVRFKCAAHRVFLDNQCTLKSDYCMESPCQNHGSCQTILGGYQCSCPSGYDGKNCQTNIDDCENNPCQNGGTCIDAVSGFTCSCQPEWTGIRCGHQMDYCVEGQITCSGHGNCRNPLDLASYVCDCNAGYTGQDCESEIDMCRSSPCIHGATCLKAVNTYRCDCVPGFYGTNCENEVKSCPTLGSSCTTTCHDIFNNYYCQCPSNTYGDNCEHQPNPCANYNKCQNGGTCSILADNSMQCTCPGKYTGDGCEELVNHCGLTNYCENGGKCSVANNAIGYTCQCALGYESTNCDVLTNNNCLTNSCPGGTCYNDVEEFYCRCPLGKTGDNCTRDFDRNYDLFFNHPFGLGFAWIPVWTLVENVNETSISVWVRFTENMGTGIFLTMFKGDRLEESERFIEFMHDGVKVYVDNGTSDHMKLLYTHNLILNDDNWHNIVFNYDLVEGKAYLIADAIIQTDIQNSNLIHPATTYKFWTVLGCEFDQKAHRCVEGGNNFNGRLSQVTWYKRIIDETEKLHSNPQMILSDPTLVWNEYQLESGVDRIIPSEAAMLSCSQRMSTSKLPECTTFIARQKPYLDKVHGCPGDLVVYSPTRITSISWDVPVYHDYVKLVSGHYNPGGMYNWGVYGLNSFATHANGNTEFCLFKIYVQRSHCDNPTASFGTGQTVVDDNPPNYAGSEIYCQDEYKYRIDRPTPNLFTCDLTGSWNIEKPFRKFRYPSCGAIKNTSMVHMELKVAYWMYDADNCHNYNTTIMSRSLTELINMNSETNKHLCKTDDCADAVITVHCETSRRRKKRATRKQLQLGIQIPSTFKSIVWGGEFLTIEEYITYKVLGAHILDFEEMQSSGTVDPSTFEIKITNTCPEGQVFLSGKCVECGPGNYDLSATLKDHSLCHDCPLGEYQDQPGMTSCKPCNSNETTEMTGAYEPSACKKKCAAGEYFDNAEGDCQPCALGFYQELEGQFYCNFCLAGRTTSNIGSTSKDACKDGCPNGKQLGSGEQCEVCPIGQYKDQFESSLCKACPAGFITATEHAESSVACNVTACEIGTRRNVSNQCEACPLGTYQDTKWQTECISCGDPSLWTTATEKSDSLSDCKLYCPTGFEFVDGKCDTCQRGYFKDSLLNNCTLCPEEFITKTIGSNSSSDCVVANCSAGYKLNDQNVCEMCPIGMFQPEKWQTECILCDTNKTTEMEGAITEDLCIMACIVGYEDIGRGCQKCARGYYKDTEAAVTCTVCPLAYITEDVGAISETSCSLSNCTEPGQYRDEVSNTCEECPIGSYNSVKWRTSCTACETDFTTFTTGNIDQSACRPICLSGYYLNVDNECAACPVGTYRTAGVSGHKCVQCPNAFLTPGVGAEFETMCTVSSCAIGEEFDVSSQKCVDCGVGYYQPDPKKLTCIQCPENQTYTTNTGAKSADECINLCDTDYCKNGATCLRKPSPLCICTNIYKGKLCAERKDAEDLSQDDWKDIVIPVGIGIGALILLLISLGVLCRMRMSNKDTKVDEFQSMKMESRPVSSDVFGLYRDSNRTMAPAYEMQFENQSYIGTADPAIYHA